MIGTVGHGSKFERKREDVILALLSTNTYAEAAARAGISLSTLTRYLKVPSFVRAFDEARLEYRRLHLVQLVDAQAPAIAGGV